MRDLREPSLQGFIEFVFIDHGPAVFMIVFGAVLVAVVWNFWDKGR